MIRIHTLAAAALVLTGFTGISALAAQDGAPPVKAPPEPKAVKSDDVTAAITRGVELLLSMQESLQEGGEKAEWPYEGVYRVGRAIPIGYRVGGTSISAMALLHAPGCADDKPRQEAIERALRFVCAQRSHPQMSETDYEAGYDVRCWGYIYAVQFICALKKAGMIPAALNDEAQTAATWYLDAMHKLEMPETGGWNYARPAGRETVGAPSPFMTGPALQAMFAAAEAGYAVDEKAVERGLATLEKGRGASGAVNYSGAAGGRREDLVPGATGRMLATETTLVLAGRGSVAAVRSSLDAFIVHWKWLEARRKQQGTHVAPYGVAPYYFMYAHGVAAQAIELLPRGERPEYRKRFLELLFSVRDEDGSWNDRVFKRTANYGTACAVLAMMAPEAPPPPRWPVKK